MKKRFTLTPLLGIMSVLKPRAKPPELTRGLLNHRLTVGKIRSGKIMREGRERNKFPKRSGMGKDRERGKKERKDEKKG